MQQSLTKSLREFELRLQHIAANHHGRTADKEIVSAVRLATSALSVALVKTFDSSSIQVSMGLLQPDQVSAIQEACVITKAEKRISVSDSLAECTLLCIPLQASESCTTLALVLEKGADLSPAIEFGKLAVTYMRLCYHRERGQLDLLDSVIEEQMDLDSFVQAPELMRTACDDATRKLKRVLQCRFMTVCETVGAKQMVTSIAGLHQLEPSSSVQQMISEVAEEARDHKEPGFYSHLHDGIREQGDSNKPSDITRWRAHAELCRAMRCAYTASQPVYASGLLVAVLVWGSDNMTEVEEQRILAQKFALESGSDFCNLAHTDRTRWLAAADTLRSILSQGFQWHLPADSSTAEVVAN